MVGPGVSKIPELELRGQSAFIPPLPVGLGNLEIPSIQTGDGTVERAGHDSVDIDGLTAVGIHLETASKLHRGRLIAIVAVCAACVLGVGAVGATFVVNASFASNKPAVTSTAPTAVDGLEGWSNTPAWTIDTASATVTLTSDGAVAGYVDEKMRVHVISTTSGEEVFGGTFSDEMSSVLYATAISGKPGLIAFSSGTVWIWSDGHQQGAAYPLPDGTHVVIRSGSAFAVGPTGVSSITDSGVVPAPSPLAGADVFGSSLNGDQYWASAKGQIITTSSVGTVAATVPLALPADGARIQRWLTVEGAHAYLVWSLPDGSAQLVAHSLVDGSIASQTPVNSSEAANGELMVNQADKAAVYGGLLIDLASGATVPNAAPFVTLAAVGSTFYGESDSKPALMGTDGSVTPVNQPDVVPVGASDDGKLLTLTNGKFAAFAVAKTSTPAGEDTQKGTP